MEKSHMKITGIVCLVISAVCIFIAVERYQTKAKKVRAIKQKLNRDSTPLGGMMKQMTGDVKIKATTPAATKYALLFAVISGVGGSVLLAKSQSSVDTQQQLT